MTLPNLSHLAKGYRYDAAPARTWHQYVEIIESAIADAPRSQQTRIGPSELGIDCTRCLAFKLAGVPEKREAAWLPFVGTCVHDGLEQIFTAYNNTHDLRFLTELTVSVGEVNGVEIIAGHDDVEDQDIEGHLDVYDIDTAEVTDWKIVGKSRLATVRSLLRKGLWEPQYHKQVHLYGRGVTRRGLPVQRVRVAYLPRNEPTLANAVIHCEAYDEQVALDALARADALAKAIATVGIDAIVANMPPTDGCWSCGRYPLPDGTFVKPPPGHNDRDLLGLIPPVPVPA